MVWERLSTGTGNTKRDEMRKATLVILTFNEIEGVKALFGRIPVKEFDEVFAIDPGSTDGTVEFLKEKGITVIIQEIRGRGEAFRVAMKKAVNENIVFFSPDGNEDPDDILKLVDCLEDGYDMAIASRFMPESRSDDTDELIRHRSFGNRLFTACANLFWGGHLTDSINGFRAIRKHRFMELKPDAHGFGIEFQMSIRALKVGHKIKEIPTFEGDRIGGESTAGSISVGWLFIKILAKELILGTGFRD